VLGRLFRLLDLNGDGVIDRAELAAALGTEPPPGPLGSGYRHGDEEVGRAMPWEKKASLRTNHICHRPPKPRV